jgi:cellulose synthase/poly-beta-1,6-N-acetylglucosamine synthase-like glycosyltransferase
MSVQDHVDVARPRAVAPAPAAGRPAGRRHDRPIRFGFEVALTRACLVVTALGLIAFEIGMVLAEARAVAAGAVWAAVQTGVFLALVTFLVYGNLVYQTARLGYLIRSRAHRSADRAAYEAMYAGPARPLVALVPSYREETTVIRQTLLSAALQEYPDKRVVLLIDDPTNPTDAENRALLQAARALPAEVERLLAAPAAEAAAALAAFEARPPPDSSADAEVAQDWLIREALHLVDLNEAAAAWFDDLADREPVRDHVDALFVEQVLREAARAHRREAEELLGSPSTDRHRLWVAHRRLVARFTVEVSSFERKAHVNLSHEPNKAMNLNSYLGLIGRTWRREERADGCHLVPATPDEADLVVPAATYVLTLDADSILVPSYAAQLVHLMETPGNERVAVAQTPYSAIPDAPGALERVAGATTDLQYIVHQGFTHHEATFWVGANALIRRAALDDLETVEEERGFPVRRFIQDRTVIEDTESSVDLIDAGWRLVNHPERLSFSATPPDFGSLIIQRRRWANGGLIILPKLLGHLARRRGGGIGGWMRVHYLSSICGVNVGLLLLLCFPFTTPDAAALIPVTALPYFVLYTRDLHQAGYRRRELIDVYALNLLLLPVNLAGVAKSVQQGVLKTKIPFGRTPKVQGRTQVPRLYLVSTLVLIGYWTVALGLDVRGDRWGHAGFELLNVALLTLAVGRFIGWRGLRDDLWRRSAPVAVASSLPHQRTYAAAEEISARV